MDRTERIAEKVAVAPAHGTRLEAAEELLRIAEELTAVKFDTRKELQEYKREHHPAPGTELKLRSEQEMKKRYQESR